MPPLKPFKPSKCSKPSASFSKATLQAGPLHLLAASHHGHLFLTAFKAAVCPPSNTSNPSNPQNPQNPQNAPNPPQTFPRQPSKQAPCTSWQPATTAICFLTAFKAAVCPSQTLQTLKMLQTFRKPFQGNPPSRPLAPLGSQPPRPYVFKGIQGCRLPALKPSNPSKCSKPSASLSKATLQAGPLHLLAASHHGHLFLRVFKAAVCPPLNPCKPFKTLQTLRKPFQGNFPSRPLAALGSQPPRPSVFKGIQGCRLPALKPLKPFKPSKTSKPSASLSKATLQAGALHLLAASHHGHLFLRAFKAAVCPPSSQCTTAICF